MPKELSPARAGSSPSSGRFRSATKNGDPSQSISVLGTSLCRVRGTSPCCRARATLMRPAIPAAASRWPMLLLTEPMPQYWLRAV
ncbi:hypothetical protein SMICM17S_00626 [Streptomyces microflavus]